MSNKNTYGSEKNGRIHQLLGPDASRNDQLKFKRLINFITIGVGLAILVFAYFNFRPNHYLLSITGFVTSAGLISINFFVESKKLIRFIARVCIVLFTAVLFYSITRGLNDGYGILSFFVFPLVLFFFLGKKDGLIWLIIVSIAWAFIFINPNLFPDMKFKGSFTIRFVSTFLLVSFFSYLIESFRERTQKKLVKERMKLVEEKERLLKAMDEIKILRGILPICSYCKSIRNDNGYYEQIEKYIHDHSGVDFSHTICPKCLNEHFPDLKNE